MDLGREPLASTHEESLRQRWQWLRTYPDYVADFENLRKRFPLHDEYERRGREQFQLIGMMALAKRLAEQGYVDRLQEIRIKYGLIGPPPDPRNEQLTIEELRLVFEPTSGFPLDAAEHSDANAKVHWALFTGTTQTVSDSENDPALARAAGLPVVSTVNGIAFQVQNEVAWIPITGWDTKVSIQAKRKLARSYLAKQTGVSRWRGRRAASELSIEVFADGVVRVPISITDSSFVIDRRIESARDLVRRRTGWRRPPQVNPWESTKVAQMIRDGTPGREALAATGLAAPNEGEPTNEQVDTRAAELELQGLPPTSARIAALRELVKYEPARKHQAWREGIGGGERQERL